MEWKKAPQEVMDAFGAALPDDGAVQRKKMFGYPAAFVNANMFACVFHESVVVRLSAERRAVAADQGATPFEPMPGRPMREYVAVPDEALSDRQALSEWLEEAFRFVAAMPPKQPKPRRQARK